MQWQCLPALVYGSVKQVSSRNSTPDVLTSVIFTDFGVYTRYSGWWLFGRSTPPFWLLLGLLFFQFQPLPLQLPPLFLHFFFSGPCRSICCLLPLPYPLRFFRPGVVSVRFEKFIFFLDFNAEGFEDGGVEFVVLLVAGGAEGGVTNGGFPAGDDAVAVLSGLLNSDAFGVGSGFVLCHVDAHVRSPPVL